MATAFQRQLSVEQRYGAIKQISTGKYGEVWIVVPLATITKGTRYVLKRINLQAITEHMRKATEREVELLSTLKHPNIIKYVESFQSYDMHFNIVMHYCEGGDLYTRIRETQTADRMFEEAKVIKWCIQICMALDYIHKQHILHRDLKTRNIFLTKQDVIKVGDFGISRVLKGVHDLATTMVGTPYYMSPEVFSSEPYNQKSDIWSLGCCMYELVNLDFAFEAEDINSLVSSVIHGAIPEIRGNYSDELKNIIRTMLSKFPGDRPTANEILEHRYIKHHILQMLEDTKQMLQKTTERKQQRKRNRSSLSSTLQSTDASSTDSLNTIESSHQQLSASQTMAGPITTFPSTSDCSPSTTDKPDIWKRCPIEMLMHYFEEYQIQDKEDSHHVSTQHKFISMSDSSSSSININQKQETSNTLESRLILDEIMLVEEDQYKMNSRYSDIGHLPDQVMLPIEGYNNERLTSLENAIQPVRHLLGNSDVAITVAKENAKKRHGILSIDESAAIQLYTMETLPLERCLYFVLNKTLRSEYRRELLPWFPYLKLLMTALWKLPSVERRVWRGIKDVDLSAKYEEGHCYTWWNLSSCTETLNLMERPQFLGTDGLRTLFSIDCIDGKEIKEHSYVKTENEILLPPATYFKVLGKVILAPGLHIIQVQQIAPPYKLISPPF